MPGAEYQCTASLNIALECLGETSDSTHGATNPTRLSIPLRHFSSSKLPVVDQVQQQRPVLDQYVPTLRSTQVGEPYPNLIEILRPLDRRLNIVEPVFGRFASSSCQSSRQDIHKNLLRPTCLALDLIKCRVIHKPAQTKLIHSVRPSRYISLRQPNSSSRRCRQV